MPFNKRNAIRQRNRTIERHDSVSTLKRVFARAEHKPLSPIRFVHKSRRTEYVNHHNAIGILIGYLKREEERETNEGESEKKGKEHKCLCIHRY